MSKYVHCLYWILVLLTSATLLSSCVSSSNGIRSSNKESLYNRVMRSGKIRCGYLIYPPGCTKNPNTGKVSGIGPEAIELVAKKLGLQVEWTEEIGWSTMLEGLKTGRYDMIPTPVWTNAHRAKLRGEFEFKEMIDTVLNEVINSGAMNKIIKKYEQAPNEVYRVALPYQLPK